MTKAIFYCAYNLNQGVSEADFMAAAEKLNDGHISKQKGYISWQHLKEGDTWADFVTFETMDDVKNFEANSHTAGELAMNFFSFINLSTCKVHYYTVERSY